MSQKKRRRAAREAEPPARHGRREGTGDVLPRRSRTLQRSLERMEALSCRPVHTIRVNEFFL